MKVFLVIGTILLFVRIAFTNTSTRLTFLKGVNRFNYTTGHTDYFFSCNVVGHFLQWQYNSEPLSGFDINSEVGSSSVNVRNTFEYTVTLLSSEPDNNNSNKAMDSIIVISFGGAVPSNFQVTCSNGLMSDTISAGNVTNVTATSVARSTTGDKLEAVLDYVASGLIVRNTLTHIFVCGVNSSSQLLQANRGSPHLFTSDNNLGEHTILSASSYKIAEQGILVAKTPYITSILIVADDAGAEVSCSSYQNEVARQLSHLSINPKFESTTINNFATTSRLETGTEPEVRQTQSTEEKNTVSTLLLNTVLPSDIITRNSTSTYGIIAAITVIILVSIACIVMVVICYKFYNAIKKM